MEICGEKGRFWIRSDVEIKEGYEREEMRRERKVMREERCGKKERLWEGGRRELIEIGLPEV